MTADTAPASPPERYTTIWCTIPSCTRPVDGNLGGPYCWTHRRTLRFSATLNDALREFLSTTGNSMRPSNFNATEIRDAGDLFAQGLAKLFGAAFGTTVAVKPQPITATTARGNKAWHVAFHWQADDGEPLVYALMDETEDLTDEYDDDQDGDDDE